MTPLFMLPGRSTPRVLLDLRSNDALKKEAAMTKWEYLVVSLPKLNTAGEATSTARLDEEGRLGWEAVGLTTLDDGGCAVLMKRPKVSLGHTSGGRV